MTLFIQEKNPFPLVKIQKPETNKSKNLKFVSSLDGSLPKLPNLFYRALNISSNATIVDKKGDFSTKVYLNNF